MKIICTNYDVKRYHGQMLGILGDDHDYSERKVWGKEATYFLLDAISGSKQTQITDLATQENFTAEIE